MSVDNSLFHEVDQHCRELRSHDVAAVHRYCALTGHLGIEFVVASSFVDPAPYRRISGDMLLVPCANVLDAASEADHWLQPGSYLYDGWLPLGDFSESSILDGLRKIDEVVALLGHIHHGPARCVVKYREIQNQRRYSRRHLTDDDSAYLSDELAKLSALPPAVRSACVRSMNWLESSRNRSSQSDRFLSPWLATESLLLTLYDEAKELGLPIEDPYAGLSKSERRARRTDDIQRLLDTTRDVQDAVVDAYFQYVRPLRGRMEAVLGALFGNDDPATTWLFSNSKAGPSPAKTRANIIHRGVSGVDAAMQTDLDSLSEELEQMLEVALLRVVDGKWGGADPSRPAQTFRVHIAMDDTVLNVRGPVQIKQRNTEITPELLWRKSLL